jgi:MFS family permease
MNLAVTHDSHLDKRIILFFVLAFSAGGVIQPFLNLYLIEVGLSGAQIGILHGWAALVTLIVTPLIGLVADRTQQHRAMLAIVAFAKGIAAPLMLVSGAWAWLVGIVSLRVISAGAHDALLNRLTLARLQETRQANLGAIRFWGALSYAVMALLAGWLARDQSVAVVFPLAGALAVAPVFLVGAFPARLAPERVASVKPRVVRPNAPLAWLLVIIFLYAFSQSGIETFGNIFLSQDLRAGNDLIGLMSGVAHLAPLPAYFLADRLVRRIGAARTMALSFGLFALAWFGYAIIAHALAALPLAILNGCGTALYIVSMVVLFGELGLPERAAMEQMLAQLTVPVLARILAQPMSGWIFQVWGARALFALDTAIVVSAIVLLFWRRNSLSS